MNYDILLKNIDYNRSLKIAIPTLEGIEYLDINSIVRVEADGRYSLLYLKNKRKLIVTKCLVEYEKLLSEFNFLRVHKSHILNLNHVKMFIRADGGQAKMSDDTIVPLSRSKKEIFIEKMNDFTSKSEFPF